MSDEIKPLTLETLQSALKGTAPAFRLRLKLQPAGGPGSKVFPPTYEKGSYAEENRRLNGMTVPCVLLDSVQAQANRMELALLRAWEDGKLDLPVISTDLSSAGNPGLKKVTSLEAPHRIADALLRDSSLEGVPFRESAVGKPLSEVTTAYATPLFATCPTALVFGMWDSTGPRGGLGVKFPRALVSEIVGINAEKGVKTSSRIDPANIKTAAGPVYKMKDSWTLDEKLADKEKSRPVKIGDGKPSEINHGNVTPTIADGSYTIDHAEQVTVLSLATLRRLKFPLKATDRSKPEVDLAARVYLAALGLLGVVLMVETADDLRSRCLLHAVEPVRWELLGKPGEPPTVYSLESADALAITKAALAAATSEGLPFHTSEVVLQPVPGLLELVRKSIQLAVAEGGNE